ncbi:HD domain-containing protein [Tautonia plasticadhaerens]|nr:hypothetical protein [Tautonia plasticadhaerens]
MLDPERYLRCLRALGAASPDASGFARLAAAYGEPARAYHSDRHIADCLAELDRSRALADRPAEVEAALWFHDAVYDPASPGNERRSVELARSVLGRCGVSGEVIARVAGLILVTSHEVGPAGRDETLMVDIDLSILGQPPGRFEEYGRQIRAEYAHVPEDAYREGRLRVLEGFASRPRIYRTAPFFERYEAGARANLAREIGALASARSPADDPGSAE